MTKHEVFVANMKKKAKEAEKPLGPQAQRATRRPANFCELGPQSQWDVDKRLGILDWTGDWDR